MIMNYLLYGIYNMRVNAFDVMAELSELDKNQNNKLSKPDINPEVDKIQF